MTKRKEVYAAIDSEREYQEGVWGATLSGNREPDTSKGESGGDRTIDEFSLYIIGYASDLQREASHFATTTEKHEKTITMRINQDSDCFISVPLKIIC